MNEPTKISNLEDVDHALDKLLLAVLRENRSLPSQAQVNRRRWFGLGLLVVGVFCIVVAAMSWPGKQAVDVAIWAGFAVVVLGVGAWQIDRASKEEQRAEVFLHHDIEMGEMG